MPPGDALRSRPVRGRAAIGASGGLGARSTKLRMCATTKRLALPFRWPSRGGKEGTHPRAVDDAHIAARPHANGL